jgi:CRISP-associated protein Cas1
VTATVTEELSVNQVLESVFDRDTENQPVITVHGYGIQIKLQHGHLVIRDGIGKHHRERKFPQADRSIRRIVVTGPDGFITLDALQYCRDHGISVTTLDPDGDLTALYAPKEGNQDARLIRRQCMAGIEDGSPVGIEITRELLTRKVNGHGDVLMKLFGDTSVSARLYHYAEQMQAAETLSELNDLERFAAKAYFETWVGRVAISWDEKSIMRIPANWLAYERRKLSASKANTHRHATDPVNAMLNYGYGLGYSEARTACIAHGLNPAIGINHGDKLGRDSLALDILEAVRPEIDAFILGLTGVGQEPYPFTYRSFHEPHGYPPGTVRLVAPLTHVIAEASYAWETTAMTAAQTVVSILNGSANRRGGKSLSLANQRAEFINRPVSVTDIVPETDWEAFQKLLPPKAKWDYASISDRTILAVYIYMQANRKPMAQIPPAFGVSRRTVHERRLKWVRSGHWPEIEHVIEDCVTKLAVK